MIRNLSRETILAREVHWALTPRERTRGLLDWEELREGQGLVISPCNSIHMFGMRFPIDVLFVDKNRCVLRAIEGIKPWRMTRIYLRARHVIELAEGTIAASRTEPGDQLEFHMP